MAHRRLPALFAVCCAAALPLSSARCQATGSFSGIVTLDKATPLAGATVRYNSVRAGVTDSRGRWRPTTPAVAGSAASGSDGTSP